MDGGRGGGHSLYVTPLSTGLKITAEPMLLLLLLVCVNNERQCERCIGYFRPSYLVCFVPDEREGPVPTSPASGP